MRRVVCLVVAWGLVLLTAGAVTGCSKETEEKASETAEKGREAAKSAAKDVEAATTKAYESAREKIHKAAKAVEQATTKPAESDDKAPGETPSP